MRTLLCCALLMMLQTTKIPADVHMVPPHESNYPIQSAHNGELTWEGAEGLPLTCKPDATGTGYFCKVNLSTDVPAVKVTKMVEDGLPINPCLDSKEACTFVGWTCADKSRVLLTSEDGARHCIKFPQGATK